MSGAAARIFKALKNVTRKKPRKAATEMVTEDISSSKADASICTQTVENDLPFIPPTPSLFNSTTDNSKTVYSTLIEHAKAEQIAEDQGGKGEQLRILAPQKEVKAHIPMIKFRKGSLLPKSTPALPESTVAPTLSSAAPTSSSPANAVNVINLEWWQTPEKFKRRTVDQLECDLINNGGADLVYQ